MAAKGICESHRKILGWSTHSAGQKKKPKQHEGSAEEMVAILLYSRFSALLGSCVLEIMWQLKFT